MKKLFLLLLFVPSMVNAQPLSLYSTDSYAYFGTLADASTFLGRQNYECKITNTGKLEGKGDGTSLPTWDISTDSDTKRIKMGGGSDTNTTHGGRMMLHGLNFSLSPGSVVLQAGNTNQVGEDGKGAFAAIYSTVSQPVIIGVKDQPYVYFEPDKRINILQKTVSLPPRAPTKGLVIRVEGVEYILPLYK